MSVPPTPSSTALPWAAAVVLGLGLGAVALPAQAAPASAPAAAPGIVWTSPRDAAGSAISTAGAAGSLQHLQYSSNWAGYAKPGRFTQVSGQFRVPRVATRPDGYASTWVGLDGYNNRYLAQIGVGEDVVHGRTTYYGWWEIITPSKVAPEQRLRLVVRPGDSLTATVGLKRGVASLKLVNNTTHHYAVRSSRFAGPGTSAEWVQEDVNVNGRTSPAPKWATVSFTSLTVNGRNPKLTSREAMDIVDHKHVRETRTSAPNRTGNAFSVSWLAAGHWQPAR